jgi:hypothetical protein
MAGPKNDDTQNPLLLMRDSSLPGFLIKFNGIAFLAVF